MNAAKVTFTEFDASFSVSAILSGIICVQGITLRGPENNTQEVIRNWPQFEKLYGGLIPSISDFPLYCKLMLESGVKLRVKRCIDEASAVLASLPVVPSTAIKGIGDGTNQPLFDLVPKAKGIDYNNLRAVVSAASNGDSNSFNLAINHVLEPQYNELYENLKIVGKPNIAASTYLSNVAANSNFCTPTYRDLTSLTGTNLRPANGTYTFSGGTNGNAASAATYTSGWSAFDAISDSITLMAPEISVVSGGAGSNAHLVGALSYVESRKNMSYVAHFDNSLTTASALVTARAALAMDSSYLHLYAGGVKWVDPVTNAVRNLLGTSHIAITMTKSDQLYGENYSYAGLQRGIVSGIVGTVNNFSSPSDLDTLANAQVNVIIPKAGRFVIWGNFTAQLAESKLSQISVRRFLNKLKLELGPIAERYLEEPMDFTTFQAFYQDGKVLLDQYTSQSKRALSSYNWVGDQDAKSWNDLVLNVLNDINQGKYKVRLILDIIGAIRGIGLALYVTKTGGVIFEEEI